MASTIMMHSSVNCHYSQFTASCPSYPSCHLVPSASSLLQLPSPHESELLIIIAATTAAAAILLATVIAASELSPYDCSYHTSSSS